MADLKNEVKCKDQVVFLTFGFALFRGRIIFSLGHLKGPKNKANIFPFSSL